MTLSNNAKRKRGKYRRFRARNNCRNCVDCGKVLNSERHYFRCNDCWRKYQSFKNRKGEN